MASFKVMRSSSNSRNSDLSRRISSSTASSSSIRPQQFRRDPNDDQSRISDGYGGRNDGFSYNTMTVEGILHETFASDPPATESSLLDASVSLMDDVPVPMEITTVPDVDPSIRDRGSGDGKETRVKSVDEVLRDIVSGEGKGLKEEIMTLEDFLAKAGVEAVADIRPWVEDATAPTVSKGESEDLDVKIPPERLDYGFDHSAAQPHNPFQMIDKVGNGLDVYGGARGKRARVMLEPLDKAAAQRQRRMIKNRESAARSRERKQAYEVELESLAAKLEEENEMLSKEIQEQRKERYHKLMEFVIPVHEKPLQQPRFLRRIRSLEW